MHLLFFLLFMKSEINPPPAFCLKDVTGNKWLCLQYPSFRSPTINWSAQSCHSYLALTKFVLFITSLGSKSFVEFAGGSPKFAVICRCCPIATEEESSCVAHSLDTRPLAPDKDNFLCGLGQQQQLAGNICTAAAAFLDLIGFNLLVAVLFTYLQVCFIVFIFCS